MTDRSFLSVIAPLPTREPLIMDSSVERAVGLARRENDMELKLHKNARTTPAVRAEEEDIARRTSCVGDGRSEAGRGVVQWR